MKYLIYITFLGGIILTGCKEEVDCSVPTTWDVDMARVELETSTIDKYLADSAIIAEEHPSGIRYIIHENGSGNNADMCNYVTKQYSIEYLDGTTVISTLGGASAERSALANDILAWQIGVPLVQESGLITIFVPSPYAYGSTARTFNNNGVNVTVPPNTILVFTIRVLKLE